MYLITVRRSFLAAMQLACRLPELVQLGDAQKEFCHPDDFHLNPDTFPPPVFWSLQCNGL